jgi:hypothetical protein
MYSGSPCGGVKDFFSSELTDVDVDVDAYAYAFAPGGECR